MEMLRQFWQLSSTDRVQDGQDFDSQVIDGNTTRDNFNCQDPVTQSSRSGLIINDSTFFYQWRDQINANSKGTEGK